MAAPTKDELTTLGIGDGLPFFYAGNLPLTESGLGDGLPFVYTEGSDAAPPAATTVPWFAFIT